MKYHHQLGFTLVEIMIAIFLVAFGVIALAMLTTTTSNDNYYNKTMTSATTMARDKIEELNGSDYTSLATGSDIIGIYSRNWVVTSSDLPSNYKTITVTVTWNWMNNPHTVELKTIRAMD